MKIVKYGTVTLHEEGPIEIEGFLCEPEATDPEGAPSEQLLLGAVLNWACHKFSVASNNAIASALRQELLRNQQNDVEAAN